MKGTYYILEVITGIYLMWSIESVGKSLENEVGTYSFTGCGM